MLAQFCQTPKRPCLILPHKAGIADHVCGKNGNQSSFQANSPLTWRLATMEGRIYAGRKILECPLLAISRHAERCARESALPPKADI